ncbi:S-adenosyl-L-methionine-dependent methyltransferase [Geopyxis carbonaria]|nr:S-adenosyl-L-methionine-dependent methyltransferase [Geopyxis carbonaria]
MAPHDFDASTPPFESVDATSTPPSKDIWSPSVYSGQVSPYVSVLATEILSWLAPTASDHILDVGCGDGLLTASLLPRVASITGVDSSPAMLAALNAAAPSIQTHCCSAATLPESLRRGAFTAVFSNSALHWILAAPPATRLATIAGIRDALAPGGRFVAELGGAGHIMEVHTALMAAVGQRGVAVPREEQPWWFPDVKAMRELVEEAGLVWVRGEIQARPTTLPQGDAEGWVRLYGAPFLDRVPEAERESVVKEVVRAVEPVGRREDGRFELGYVRLRFEARKPLV